MTNELSTVVLVWLATYALHSTCLLGGVWLFERVRSDASPTLRATLWRTALLGAIVTATLQTTGVVKPLSGELFVVGADHAAPANSTSITAPLDAAATLAPPADGAAATGLPSSTSGVAAGRAPNRAASADLPSASPPDSAGPTTASAVRPAVQSADANARRIPDITASVSAVPKGTTTARLDWRVVLVAAWLLGAIVLAGRVALMMLALRREVSDRHPVIRGPLFERMGAIAHRAGLKRLPRLSSSANIEGPLTLPGGEICIPVWAHDGLSTNQLDALLAHEMAHWIRRDAQWLVASVVIQSLLFFQPLNWLGHRRQAALAELSADDWSATHTGHGLALAECLAAFAEATQRRPPPVFAATMAHKRSALVHRIERLLEARYDRTVPTLRAKLVICVVAVIAVAVLPGVAAKTTESDGTSERPEPSSFQRLAAAKPFGGDWFDPDQPDYADPSAADLTDVPDFGRLGTFEELLAQVDEAELLDPNESIGSLPAVRSFANSGEDRSVNISVRRRGYQFELDAYGEIALEADASGLASLGTGAYLDATLRRGQARRVRLEGTNGEIARQHWLDGGSQPWDNDAELLVREVVLTLFRSTGIGAAERLAWLLENGGPDRLLDEIAKIDSDSVQRLYTELFAASGALQSRHLRRLVALAGDRISSDSQLRAALMSVYESQRPTGAELVAVVEAGRSISSDSQALALLDAIGDSLPDRDLSVYLDITRNISSDQQLRTALARLIRRNKLSDDRFGEVLTLAARTIDSDSQLGGLLRNAAPRIGSSDVLARTYLGAVASIGSDSQKRGTLHSLADAARLSPEAWRMLLHSALGIGSDSQRASLLVSIAGALPRDEETLAAYGRVLATIGSSSQARRARQAIK